MARSNTARIYLVVDDRGFHVGMNKAASKLAAFGTKVKAIGAGMQSVGSTLTRNVTLPIVASLGLATKAAVDEEKEMALLSKALVANAGATDEQVAAVERWITAQQNATGISDGQLRPALANLVRVTKDTGEAQGLLGTAMDISVAKGKSLETVSMAIAKAYAGNVGALGRLGIATKDATGKTMTFDQVMARAVSTFGGSAATAATTTAGKMAILKARFADIAESIGNAVIPILEKLVPYVEKVAKWFENLSDSQRSFIVKAALVVAAVGPVIKVLGLLTSGVGGAIKVVTVLTRVLGKVGPAAAGATTKMSAMGGVLRGLPGLIGAAAVAVPLLAAAFNKISQEGGWKEFTDFWKNPFNTEAEGKLKGIAADLAEINELASIKPASITSIQQATSAMSDLSTARLKVKALQAEGVISASDANKILARIGQIESGVKTKFASLTVSADKSGKETGQKLNDGIANAIPTIGKTGQSAVDAFAERVGAGAPKAQSSGSKLGLGASAGMSTGKGAASKAGSTSGGSYVAGVDSKKGAASKAGTGLANAAKPPASSWFGLGATAGTSFASGLSSAIGTVIAAGAAIAAAALTAARNRLKSQSPSREFIALGAGASEGLAIGIKGGTSVAVASTVNLALSVVAAMKKALGGLKGKKAKSLTAASDLISPIQDLLNLVIDAGELLDQIKDAEAPALDAKAKTAVRAIVSSATSIADTVAKELNKVYGKTWVGAKKDKKGKVVKEGYWKKTAKQTRMEQAAEAAGPLASLVSFIVDVQEALNAIVDNDLPTMDSEVKLKTNAFIRQAVTLAGYVSDAIRAAFTDTDALTEDAEASSAIGGILGDVSSVLSAFSALTDEGIDTAIVNIQGTRDRAPEIGAALKETVDALRLAFADVGDGLEDVTDDEGGTTLGLGSIVTKVTGVFTDIAGVLSSVLGLDSSDQEGGMTISAAIDAAIAGAKLIAGRAGDLGTALTSMLAAIGTALGDISADSLTALKDAMESLSAISTSISDIVGSLSDLTAEKISAAATAGEELGKGFLTGLKAWHDTIVSEATSINRDVLAALAGTGGSGAAADMARAIRVAVREECNAVFTGIAVSLAAT